MTATATGVWPRRVLLSLGQSFVILASLYVFLKGWHRELRVPLDFSSDSLFYLMQSKSTIDNGWWWRNPMLGAPASLNELAFPSNSNVDQSIVWMVSRLVSHPLAAVNLAWVCMVVLSGLSAMWCLRRLGVSAIAAFVAGTLFAVSPYAIYRNIGHFSMVIYLVPFACTLSLLLAAGEVPERRYWGGAFGGLLAGCALLGFNYVYYAFFGCFFAGVAAAVGYLAHGRRRILACGALGIGLMAGCTLINLAPSLYVISRQGTPSIIRPKVPAEAEVYGLKIRQLVSPVFAHSFPPFRWWTEKEAGAHFPLETENMISRLGLVGSIGFLGLLALLMVPSAANRFAGASTLLSASRLTIAALLLATIGGFGSLFSLLVSPEIRAYNRIAPFIAFFSLAAVAVALDGLAKTRARKLAAGVVVLGLGLADQRMAAAPGLNAAYAGISAELPGLEAFVRQLELQLPDRAMVFQLPLRTFLDDDGVARMRPYDHLKLYAVSRRLHWSYPALSNDQVAWQRGAGRLPLRELPYQLAAEGFAAIVVDRFGYDDNGQNVVSTLRGEVTSGAVIVQTDRYLAIDVRALAGANPLSTKLVPASASVQSCGTPTLAVGYIDEIGEFAAPFAGKTIRLSRDRRLWVTGWAVDAPHQAAAAAVDVAIDGTAYATVYGADRRDVVNYFKQPAYLSTGFAAAIPAGSMVKGVHTLSLRVVSSNGACYSEGSSVGIVVE